MTLPVSRPRRPPILLTGATGYVGGRLLRVLEERGERVRCLTRRPEAVAAHRDTTTIVAGDVLELESLRPAMRGVETAYYLVHSMTSATSFEEQDRRGAANFAAAAREAGVRRIVYLGGLGAGGDLSSHLSSRQEVGRILADSGVQTIEFRASIVIGSGSLSFEMLRKLVERLPVMITPRWVRTKAQPIAIEDVLDYLVARLDVELEGSAVFEIGGADQVSYEELMREYARQLGLRRWIIPVPLLTATAVEPLARARDARVRPCRSQADRQPSARDRRAGARAAVRAFPIRPAATGKRSPAPSRNEDREFAETRWSDAVVLRRAGPRALRRRAPRQAPGRLPLDPGAGLSRRRRFVRSGGSAARRAGTSATPLAAARLHRPARRRRRRAPRPARSRAARRSDRRSTSGASRPTSRTVCSGCRPR